LDLLSLREALYVHSGDQAMTIKGRRLSFTSTGEEAIQLEGILHHPGGKNLPAAVNCHPHSLYGGSMDVSLVVSSARTLAERGIIAFRYVLINLRALRRIRQRKAM